VQDGPARGSSRREPDARPVRIEGEAVRSNSAAALDCRQPGDRCRLQPYMIEPCCTSALIFTLQPARTLGVRARQGNAVASRKIAPNAQPTNGRGKIQRRPSHHLPHRPRRAEAMRERAVAKRCIKVLANQTWRLRRAATTYRFSFEKDRSHPGSSKRPCRNTPGQSASDNDDVRFEIASITRKRAAAGLGITIEPEWNVTNRHVARKSN